MTIETRSALEDSADGLYQKVCAFLFHEAILLDSWELNAWLDLLEPDYRYVLTGPTIAMVGGTASKQPTDVVLMKDTLGSLRARVKQLTTPSLTLADNPRPIVRRYVANILVSPGEAADTLFVRSNALIYRSRGHQDPPHIFSTSRRDTLLLAGDGFRLSRRDATLDEAVVGSRNISGLF